MAALGAQGGGDQCPAEMVVVFGERPEAAASRKRLALRVAEVVHRAAP